MRRNEHFGILIRNAHLSIAGYVMKQLKPFHLAPEQNLIMMMLWEKDGIAPNEFSQELNKDKASITRMIASLEKKGFVEKVIAPEDRRTFKVQLTRTGKELEQKVVPVLQKSHQDVLKNIPEEKLKEMQDSLNQIILNISGGNHT